MARDAIHEHEHHEHHYEERGNGAGFFLGIMMLVILVALFLVYGLPYLRNSLKNEGTQINIPDRVQIDMNQPGQSQ